MSDLIAYFNGKFVPDSQCLIHATDRGFRVGDVVYDLQRTFGGNVFRLREHLERFMRSLGYARLDCYRTKHRRPVGGGPTSSLPIGLKCHQVV